MPQDRMLDDPPVERYRPRPSGVAIGIMVEALGLGDLSDPLARRWIVGEPIADDARAAAAASIARAFVDAGIRVAPALALDQPESSSDAIHRFCAVWDAVGGQLEHGPLCVRAEDGPWLAFAFLRLVAIDLAMRGAAAQALEGRSTARQQAGTPLDGLDEPIVLARKALARPWRAEHEREELADQLEAGLRRLLERGGRVLGLRAAPGRDALRELVERGTQASAARWLVERLRATETDPLWATDLRAACEPWIDHLGRCAGRLASEPDAELPLHGILERAARRDTPPTELEALRSASLWIVEADHPRDTLPERRTGRKREPFVLPVDDHTVERARAIQHAFVHDEDGLVCSLEHGRRALWLAPDDPELLVAVGATLAERACACRYPGWEYHADVGLALLRRATWLEPRWDRPWVEIGIVLADVGAWDRARRWFERIPATVSVTARLSRLRALLRPSAEPSH
jgi:hypothetical protein